VAIPVKQTANIENKPELVASGEDGLLDNKIILLIGECHDVVALTN